MTKTKSVELTEEQWKRIHDKLPTFWCMTNHEAEYGIERAIAEAAGLIPPLAWEVIAEAVTKLDEIEADCHSYQDPWTPETIIDSLRRILTQERRDD